MLFSMPIYTLNNLYRLNPTPKSYKTLEDSLVLVRDSIQTENEDEISFSYLISIAPTQEEKNIIATIRDDEIKHYKYFKEIYMFYTGQDISPPPIANVLRPKSYIEGITNAEFSELDLVERYRDIRAGLPDEYYRDMVFEIITDELKHTHKYEYILYLSLITAGKST